MLPTGTMSMTSLSRAKRLEDLYDKLHGVIGWDCHALSAMMGEYNKLFFRHHLQWVARLRFCNDALIVAYENQK